MRGLLIAVTICFVSALPLVSLSQVTDAGTYSAVAKQACVRAAGLPYPRALAQGSERLRWEEALRAGGLAKDFSEFAGRVRRDDARTPYLANEPALPPSATWNIAGPKSVQVHAAVSNIAQLAQQAMLLYLVNRDPEFKAIAVRRLENFARLDTGGITGVASNDLAAMNIVMTLGLGLDRLSADTDMSPALRDRIRASIEARMRDFETRLVRGSKSLRADPKDSHGYPALGAMAAVALMTSDQVASSSRLCSEVVGLFLDITSPWGGADGGSSQGTAYAIWDLGVTLPFFDTLKWAGGVDLSGLAWLHNFGRFLVYFQPPGTPSALFGDGAELDFAEYRARFAKAYLRRMPANPLYDWYDASLFGNDPLRLETLTVAPRHVDARNFPAGTPNGAIFESIGWAAMHSDLRFRDRVSVYFKSSPFGSGAHGHADQNSFVINAKGKQLLADGGYYDYYGSPHHLGWTKLTAAHNAITFDGGKGQPLGRGSGSYAANGNITQFQTTADYDLVTGNALPAYGGDITAATRSIAYIRPNTVVVFDLMSATVPHQWEWNFQSVGTLAVDPSSGIAKVANGGVQACLHFLSNLPSTASASSGFAIPPQRTPTEPRPDQWHGMFKTTGTGKTFWAATVIDIGCESSGKPEIQFSPGNTVVRVAGKTMMFDGKSVQLQK